MLAVSKFFPDYNFVVAKSPGLEDSFYETFFNSLSGAGGNISAVKNKTYELLMQSSAALVTSGTATLETALFAVPEAVCYKAGTISYEIGKRVVNVKFISLVNLIMDKLVVKEFIQNELTVKNLTAELNELLNNQERRKQLAKDYADLKSLLSQGGHASAKAAKSIYDFIKK